MVLAAWLGALAAAPASAQAPAEQQLQSIRELVFAARFSDAVTAARSYLDRTDLTAAERNAGLEVLATAQIANRQRDDAAQTLQLLYSRDPGHRLTDPDASPPVISAFARARESEPPTVPVRLEHEPPVLERREPPHVVVRVAEGADAVAEVRLMYRAGDEGTARVVMTRRPDGTYAARIPVVGDASSATDVAYHVVALSPSLTPLGGIGSAAEPLQLRIPAEASAPAEPARAPVAAAPLAPAPTEPADEGGSVVEQWWFWTVLGVLVVGGAVTAAVLLGPGQQAPEEGTLGTATLTLTRF
jgi:hypothetical protein